MEEGRIPIPQSPLTCITCRVAFRNLETQREHYKSDWHRYNLKRKVSELPPVSVEQFGKRLIAQQVQETEEKGWSYCTCCKKKFSSEHQHKNHLMSKKHKENSENSLPVLIDGDEKSSATNVQDAREIEEISLKELEIDEDSDIETIDSDEWLEDTENPVNKNDCLFCDHHSRSLVRNLKHMTEAHSFFIPDPEYCVDLKGLVMYLGEKIFAGYMCIWCNEKGKAFHSAEGAQAHMLDKGHCKMLHEGEALAEYAHFYDYSSSYPDAENIDPDTEVEISELDDGDYQLALPSGSVIGHRSLRTYYKQSFNPNRALAVPRSNKLKRVLHHYRALGWKETQKEVVTKKARDIKHMQKRKARYSTKLQFKANKMQKHFRRQVEF